MKKHTLFAVAALGLLFAGSTLLPGELSPVGSAYAKGGNGGGNGGGDHNSKGLSNAIGSSTKNDR